MIAERCPSNNKEKEERAENQFKSVSFVEIHLLDLVLRFEIAIIGRFENFKNSVEEKILHTYHIRFYLREFIHCVE